MLTLLQDAVIDALVDSIKILPFLFIAYLLMEYVENRMGEQSKDVIRHAGRKGPILGAILGAFPQCGFGAAASNLYAGRMISIGTLLAIYLSTSDEMLPIMISEGMEVSLMLMILGIKILYGMVIGLGLDAIFHKSQKIRANAMIPREDERFRIKEMCQQDHCKCSHGLLRPALQHSLHVLAFLFLVAVIFNVGIEAVGEESLGQLIIARPYVGVIFSGIIGLIPNCAASVIVTDLYIRGVITFGAMMSGLFVGAGVSLIILFRVNEDWRENGRIITWLYLAGVLGGLCLEALTGLCV